MFARAPLAGHRKFALPPGYQADWHLRKAVAHRVVQRSGAGLSNGAERGLTSSLGPWGRMMRGKRPIKVVPFRKGSKPSPRLRHPGMMAAFRTPLIIPMLMVAVGGGFLFANLMTSKWPLDLTIRHWLAAPNCAAARMVGLAPARMGQPGYYSHHDADRDGIACESWRGR
jgi:hypothetical protein